MDSLRGKAHWLVLAAVLSLLVLSSVPAPLSVSTSAANEDRLALSPLPRNLPTNSSGVSTFSALVVSLDNAQGRPTVALNDTVVYLSSSETAVLTVQSSVTILAGSQYAIASVTTGETPGSSSVTAVSPGIESGSTQFNTYVPRGYPTQLEVYPLPPTFAANESATATYVVIVEDGAGLPARTVGNTPVQVTSSNLTVAQTGNAQIPVNETVAYGTLSTTGHWGTASITASASGLLSSSAIVSTLPL